MNIQRSHRASVNGRLAQRSEGAGVSVDNSGSCACVPTLVAQRLRSETYESPALPLSYSATDSALRPTGGLSNEHRPRIPTVDNSGNSTRPTPTEPEHLHRLSTITASQLVAVGGNPVSNLALTSASLLPWGATVVGTWNRGLVMTPSTVARDRSELNFSSVT